MTEEIKFVDVVAGPYSGKRLQMSAADADAAVADGWATDPNAPPPDPKEKPKDPPTEEQRNAMLEKAEKAARKLRGEKEPVEDLPNLPKRRDMHASESGGYSTRSTTTKEK